MTGPASLDAAVRAAMRTAIAAAVETCNAAGHPDPGQIYDSTRPCVDCATDAAAAVVAGRVLQVEFVEQRGRE